MLHSSTWVPCHSELTQKQMVFAPGRKCSACSCSEDGVVVLRSGRRGRPPTPASRSDEMNPSADSAPARLVGVSLPSGGVGSVMMELRPPAEAQVELVSPAGTTPARVSAGMSESSMSSMLMATTPCPWPLPTPGRGGAATATPLRPSGCPPRPAGPATRSGSQASAAAAAAGLCMSDDDRAQENQDRRRDTSTPSDCRPASCDPSRPSFPGCRRPQCRYAASAGEATIGGAGAVVRISSADECGRSSRSREAPYARLATSSGAAVA
mmetsp:Transcript_3253/g.10974  ORF Transcript_3253/g.10974 Transcript_3253/m.10974 type:complete len:267 (-) Transcript_3253:1170-1970(-)|eukprot:scaffold2477_cov95-Isochrysis_galbana.AAC.5